MARASDLTSMKQAIGGQLLEQMSGTFQLDLQEILARTTGRTAFPQEILGGLPRPRGGVVPTGAQAEGLPPKPSPFPDRIRDLLAGEEQRRQGRAPVFTGQPGQQNRTSDAFDVPPDWARPVSRPLPLDPSHIERFRNRLMQQRPEWQGLTLPKPPPAPAPAPPGAPFILGTPPSPPNPADTAVSPPISPTRPTGIGTTPNPAPGVGYDPIGQTFRGNNPMALDNPFLPAHLGVSPGMVAGPTSREVTMGASPYRRRPSKAPLAPHVIPGPSQAPPTGLASPSSRLGESAIGTFGVPSPQAVGTPFDLQRGQQNRMREGYQKELRLEPHQLAPQGPVFTPQIDLRQALAGGTQFRPPGLQQNGSGSQGFPEGLAEQIKNFRGGLSQLPG